MGLAPARFGRIDGLSFARLMGSGAGNGFSLWPNFGVYAFVGHWADVASADAFFEADEWLAAVRARAAHLITWKLEATMSHGAWGGKNPFTPRLDAYDPAGPVAVITRATIHPHKLPEFWRKVPATSRSVADYPERLLSVGIGEYPIFMQATFSVWTSGQAMTDFAYQGTHHREVVKLTRQRGWYREELFSRFRILNVEGTWPGFDENALSFTGRVGPFPNVKVHKR